jgi:16S rRNA processing protein RimM
VAADPYDPETVTLGVVGKPHGIRGELWLRPHNVQGADSFASLRTLLLVKGGVTRAFTVASLHVVPDGAIVKLEGVDGREAAAALTLSEVRAPRSKLPPLAQGEFYVGDVIGCAVIHEDGTSLGVARGTFWNGAHDVMIVEGQHQVPELPTEHLIPLLPQFVLSVDVTGRKVVVSWEGHD